MRIGWRWVTDYDFILPLPVACWAAVFGLERVQKLVMKVTRQRILIHTSVLFLFMTWTFAQKSIRPTSSVAWESIWYLLLITLLVSGLLLPLGWRQIREHPQRWVLFPAGLITFTTPLSNSLFSEAWPYLAQMTGAWVHRLCSVFYQTSIQVVPYLDHSVVLRNPDFAIAINRKCGGLDAFWLFWQSGLFLAIILPYRVTWLRWGLFGILGFILMFELNALRITSLYLLGVFLSKTVGYGNAINTVMLLFHLNSGWILYLLGIGFYFKIALELLNTSGKVSLVKWRL